LHEQGYRCVRHEITFPRNGSCKDCLHDPGLAPGVEQSSGEIDREIADLARKFSSHANKLWNVAADLLEGELDENNVAAKLSAESAKWERLALEAKDRIAARKHLREAMAHERSMSARRGHN
jgi:hypothetical protein